MLHLYYFVTYLSSCSKWHMLKSFIVLMRCSSMYFSTVSLYFLKMSVYMNLFSSESSNSRQCRSMKSVCSSRNFSFMMSSSMHPTTSVKYFSLFSVHLWVMFISSGCPVFSKSSKIVLYGEMVSAYRLSLTSQNFWKPKAWNFWQTEKFGVVNSNLSQL